MGKKVLFPFLGVLTCSIMCLLFVVIGYLPSWLPATSRKPPVDIRTLVINVENLPPGWTLDGSPESYPSHSDLDWGEMNWITRFQSVRYQGFASQSVFKFRNQLAAIYGEYRIINQGYLFDKSSSNVDTPSYKSQYANSWELNCRKGDGDIRVCNVIARYDEYVTYFLIAAPQSQITREDIENILSAIDNLMAKNLHNDK